VCNALKLKKHADALKIWTSKFKLTWARDNKIDMIFGTWGCRQLRDGERYGYCVFERQQQ
jgi:hypothetical protein